MERIKSRIENIKSALKSRKINKKAQRLFNLKKRFVEKGMVDQILFTFFRNIKDTNEQKTLWQILLKRKDLTSVNYFDISEVIDDEQLKIYAEQQYIKVSDEEGLRYAIRYGREAFKKAAFEKLCERIQRGRIKKGQAREVLYKIFEEVQSYREKSLNVIGYLEPTDTELEDLLHLPFMDNPEFGDLKRRIEKLKRNKPKKDNTKIISQIKDIEDEIHKLKGAQE